MKHSPETKTDHEEAKRLQEVHDGMKQIAAFLFDQPKQGVLMDKRDFPGLGYVNWFRPDDEKILIVATQYLPEDDSRHSHSVRTGMEVSCSFDWDGEGLHLDDIESAFTISTRNSAQPDQVTVNHVGFDGDNFVLNNADKGVPIGREDLVEADEFVEKLRSNLN